MSQNMTLIPTHLKELSSILGLSENERKIIKAILENPEGLIPTRLCKTTDLARGSVYLVLQNLKKRRLVDHHKNLNIWTKSQKLQNIWVYVSRELIHGPKSESISNMHDALDIRVYSTKEAIVELYSKLVLTNQNQRVYSFQGLKEVKGWLNTVGLDKIIELNEKQKETQLIEERVLPRSYFKTLKKALGDRWVESYIGPMTSTSIIDDSYFDSPVELLIKGNSVFIVWMEKAKIIELISEDVAKLFKNMFRFIAENSKKVRVQEEFN